MKRIIYCILMLLAVPALAQSPAPVVATSVTLGAIQEDLLLNGSVLANRVSGVSVATPGQVLEVAVEVGQRVAQGDLLLSLDDELARWELQSANARRLQVHENLENTRRRAAEAKRLHSEKSFAESALRDLEAEVRRLQAQLLDADAQARFRKSLLQRHRLIAPFDGVVSQRKAESGEWVSPGQPVLQLVSVGEVWLEFSVPEDYLARVQQGGVLHYITALAPEQWQPATSLTVVPVADVASRTFKLRSRIAAEHSLTPGLSVKGRLRVPAGRNGLLVPRDALLRYPDGRIIVWVLVEDEQGFTVRDKPVRTGTGFADKIEILEGLSGDEKVVVRGNESLFAGQSVRLMPES